MKFFLLTFILTTSSYANIQECLDVLASLNLEQEIQKDVELSIDRIMESAGLSESYKRESLVIGAPEIIKWGGTPGNRFAAALHYPIPAQITDQQNSVFYQLRGMVEADLIDENEEDRANIIEAINKPVVSYELRRKGQDCSLTQIIGRKFYFVDISSNPWKPLTFPTAMGKQTPPELVGKENKFMSFQVSSPITFEIQK